MMATNGWRMLTGEIDATKFRALTILLICQPVVHFAPGKAAIMFKFHVRVGTRNVVTFWKAFCILLLAYAAGCQNDRFRRQYPVPSTSVLIITALTHGDSESLVRDRFMLD